jgi:hypothetical protein
MPNYSQYLGCCCVKRLREFTRSKTFAIAIPFHLQFSFLFKRSWIRS